MSAINMAAPPRINLLGEIILISSSIFVSFWLIPGLSIVCFVSAAYSLVLYTSSQHGQPSFFFNYMTFKS